LAEYRTAKISHGPPSAVRLHCNHAPAPAYFVGRRVLEVGSLDINGSVRTHFEACDYIGADLAEGPGVDIACPGQLLAFPSGHFDVAISCECFEHNPYWVETFINMLRMTREDGLLIVSCATTRRREHGTARTDAEASPFTSALGWTYYRNLTERDVRDRVPLANWLEDFFFIASSESYDLYFVGLRRGVLPEALRVALSRRFSSWRSVKTIRRRIKMALLGDTLSSPLREIIKGRR
jgi:SAM-dependent methyltransferase